MYDSLNPFMSYGALAGTYFMFLHYLDIIAKLLGIFTIVSVVKQIRRRMRHNKENIKVSPLLLIFRKLLKNWIMWYVFLVLFTGGFSLYIHNIEIATAKNAFVMFAMFTIKWLVLAIPYSYFSMLYFRDSWDSSSKAGVINEKK